jgi:hypothetical protein
MGRSSTKVLVTKAAGCDWKGLYTIGGVTTIAMTLLFLCDIVFWIMLGPYPGSAQGWFTLLEEKRLVGLLLLSFPTFFGAILYYLTFLGLYHILRRVNPAYAALAALLAFVGLTILLVTHMAYPMVYLSAQHAAASTETQRSLLLAAGETRIAVTMTGVNLGGFLVEFVFPRGLVRARGTRRRSVGPTPILPCRASRMAGRCRCPSFGGTKSSCSTWPRGERVADRPCRPGTPRRKNGFDRASSW